MNEERVKKMDTVMNKRLVRLNTLSFTYKMKTFLFFI